MTIFSVLICTYNRHQLLSRSLSALIERTTEKPDQIIIVNGGDQRAERIVKEYQQAYEVNLKLIQTINKNLAANRNIGLPHCSGDIIAMTDDDAQVFPDWVTEMKRAHLEHPEAGAVGGVVVGTNTETIIGRVADAITFPTWQDVQAVRTLPGVNISYKRKYIEQIGPQDEELFRGEDVDYNWRVQKMGGLIWFDPAIKVYHYHRPTLRGFINQHYMYGRAYFLVRRKWQDMYCVYPHHLTSIRDILKLGNFFAALVYQPFLSSMKMNSHVDKVMSLPLLFAAHLAWKWGMMVQKLKPIMS